MSGAKISSLNIRKFNISFPGMLVGACVSVFIIVPLHPALSLLLPITPWQKAQCPRLLHVFIIQKCKPRLLFCHNDSAKMSKKCEKLHLLQKMGTAWDKTGTGIISILQYLRRLDTGADGFFRDTTISNDWTGKTMWQDVLKDRHQGGMNRASSSQIHKLIDSPDSFMDEWDSSMPHHLLPAPEHFLGSGVWIGIK